MNEKKIKLLKKIVEFNKKIINKNNGDFNNSLNEVIFFDYKGYSIWNPFKDETSRFEIDPLEKYGEEKIKKFIKDYKKKN